MAQFLNNVEITSLAANKILITDGSKVITTSAIASSDLSKLNILINNGDGNKYLSNDGTYKLVTSDSAKKLVDAVTITDYNTFVPLEGNSWGNITPIIAEANANFVSSNTSQGFAITGMNTDTIISTQSGLTSNAIVTRSRYQNTWGPWQRIAMQDWTSSQLATKQNTITGAATTITGSNLVASCALISDANGKVAASSITATELGYLDGITANAQTQFNNRVLKTGAIMTGTLDYDSTTISIPAIRYSGSGSWLNGAKGQAAIQLDGATSGNLKCIATVPSTNGRFVIGSVNTAVYVGYISNTNINAGTNALSMTNVICSEAGGMAAQGVITQNSGMRLVQTSKTAAEAIYEVRVMSKAAADSGWASIPNNTVVFCY